MKSSFQFLCAPSGLNERDVVDIETMEDNLSMLVLDDLKNISLGIQL